MELQELLALGTVAGTVALFVLRRLRRPRIRPSCGSGCDCPANLQVHGQSDILKRITQ